MHATDPPFLRADPVLGKFAKMCSMGVPAPAARMKMVAEGISAVDMLRFELAFGLMTPEEAQARDRKAAAAQAISPPEAPPVSKDDLKADPVLGKFAKMCLMGVPPASVAFKMVAEGIDPLKVSVFKKCFGLESSPRKPSAPGAAPGSSKGALAAAKLITVHWDALLTVSTEPQRRSCACHDLCQECK